MRNDNWLLLRTNNNEIFFCKDETYQGGDEILPRKINNFRGVKKIMSGCEGCEAVAGVCIHIHA